MSHMLYLSVKGRGDVLRNEAHLSVIDALPIVSTSYVNFLIEVTYELTRWIINYFLFP